MLLFINEKPVKLHREIYYFSKIQFNFSELFDVGGSHGHRNSRHVFYNNYQGIILVHDLSNRKSEQNLERWLREIVQYSNRCDL